MDHVKTPVVKYRLCGFAACKKCQQVLASDSHKLFV